jgi:hypothetical protein
MKAAGHMLLSGISADALLTALALPPNQHLCHFNILAPCSWMLFLRWW